MIIVKPEKRNCENKLLKLGRSNLLLNSLEKCVLMEKNNYNDEMRFLKLKWLVQSNRLKLLCINLLSV